MAIDILCMDFFIDPIVPIVWCTLIPTTGIFPVNIFYLLSEKTILIHLSYLYKQGESMWKKRQNIFKTCPCFCSKELIHTLSSILAGNPSSSSLFPNVTTREVLVSLQIPGSKASLLSNFSSLCWLSLPPGSSVLCGTARQQLAIWKRNSFRAAVGGWGRCDKHSVVLILELRQNTTQWKKKADFTSD